VVGADRRTADTTTNAPVDGDRMIRAALEPHPMEYELLGWPADGPTLDLDHRRFAYAGKFVMSDTGKAVARDGGPDGGVVAAVSFSPDRDDGDLLWLRYITTRQDHQGTEVGARLARFAVDRARGRYDRVRIAVNNPFAYHALWKAGFAYTGEESGLAELVLAVDGERSRSTYQAGLDVFRERDLSKAEESFLAAKAGSEPPRVVPAPE